MDIDSQGSYFDNECVRNAREKSPQTRAFFVGASREIFLFLVSA